MLVLIHMELMTHLMQKFVFIDKDAKAWQIAELVP